MAADDPSRDQMLAMDDHAQPGSHSSSKGMGRTSRERSDRGPLGAGGHHPTVPDIGGSANPMTRHLLRSTTSLALYLAMRRRGYAAQEAGWVIYQAVVARVATLPRQPFTGLTPERVAAMREEAARSQERRYPGDWVWEFVEGDGGRSEYGFDFLECGTQKLYRAHDAEEFLPFYCYLDFVTYRAEGWGFCRTKTLAEGTTAATSASAGERALTPVGPALPAQLWVGFAKPRSRQHVCFSLFFATLRLCVRSETSVFAVAT